MKSSRISLSFLVILIAVLLVNIHIAVPVAGVIDLNCTQVHRDITAPTEMLSLSLLNASGPNGAPCDLVVVNVRANGFHISAATPMRSLTIVDSHFEYISVWANFTAACPSAPTVVNAVAQDPRCGINITRVTLVGGLPSEALLISPHWTSRLRALLSFIVVEHCVFRPTMLHPQAQLSMPLAHIENVDVDKASVSHNVATAQLGFVRFELCDDTVTDAVIQRGGPTDNEPGSRAVIVVSNNSIVKDSIAPAGYYAVIEFYSLIMARSIEIVDNKITYVERAAHDFVCIICIIKIARVFGNLTASHNNISFRNAVVTETKGQLTAIAVFTTLRIDGHLWLRGNDISLSGRTPDAIRFGTTGGGSSSSSVIFEDNTMRVRGDHPKAHVAIGIVLGETDGMSLFHPLRTFPGGAVFRNNRIETNLTQTEAPASDITLCSNVDHLQQRVTLVVGVYLSLTSGVSKLVVHDNIFVARLQTTVVATQPTAMLVVSFNPIGSFAGLSDIVVRNNQFLLSGMANILSVVGLPFKRFEAGGDTSRIVVEDNTADFAGLGHKLDALPCPLLAQLFQPSFREGTCIFVGLRAAPDNVIIRNNKFSLWCQLDRGRSAGARFADVGAFFRQVDVPDSLLMQGNIFTTRVPSSEEVRALSSLQQGNMDDVSRLTALQIFVFAVRLFSSVVIRDNVFTAGQSGQVEFARLVNLSLPSSNTSVEVSRNTMTVQKIAGAAIIDQAQVSTATDQVSTVLVDLPPQVSFLVLPRDGWGVTVSQSDLEFQQKQQQQQQQQQPVQFKLTQNSILEATPRGSAQRPATCVLLRGSSATQQIDASGNKLLQSSCATTMLAVDWQGTATSTNAIRPTDSAVAVFTNNEVHCSAAAAGASGATTCAIASVAAGASTSQQPQEQRLRAVGNTFITTSATVTFSLLQSTVAATLTPSPSLLLNISRGSQQCNELISNNNKKQRINKRLLLLSNDKSNKAKLDRFIDDTGCESTASHSKSISVSQIVLPPPPPYRAPPATIANNVAQGVTMASAAFAAAVLPAMSFNVARQQAMVSLVDRARTGSCAGIAPEITPGPAESPTQMQLGDSIGKWFAGAAVGNFIFSLSLVLVAQLTGTLFLKQTGSSSWNRPFAVFARCHVAMVLFVCLSLLASPSLSMALVVVTVAEVPLGLRIVAMLFALLLAGTTAFYTIWALFKRERKEKYKKLPQLPPQQIHQQPNFLQRGFTYWFEGAGEWVMPGGNKCTEQEHLDFDAANPQIDGFNSNAPWFSAVEFSTQLGLALAGFIAQLVPEDKSCVTQAVVIVVVLTSYLALALWKRPFQELFLRIFTPIMVVCQIVICVIVAAMASSGDIPAWIDALVVLTVSLQSVMSVLVVLATIAPMSKWIIKAWNRFRSRGQFRRANPPRDSQRGPRRSTSRDRSQAEVDDAGGTYTLRDLLMQSAADELGDNESNNNRASVELLGVRRRTPPPSSTQSHRHHHDRDDSRRHRSRDQQQSTPRRNTNDHHHNHSSRHYDDYTPHCTPQRSSPQRHNDHHHRDSTAPRHDNNSRHHSVQPASRVATPRPRAVAERESHAVEHVGQRHHSPSRGQSLRPSASAAAVAEEATSHHYRRKPNANSSEGHRPVESSSYNIRRDQGGHRQQQQHHETKQRPSSVHRLGREI